MDHLMDHLKRGKRIGLKRGGGAMGNATLGCPVQEGPYLAVSPSAVGQPVVNVALVHGGEGAPTVSSQARKSSATSNEFLRRCAASDSDVIEW